MQTEQNFSEQDSLRLINEMIGKAKKSYVTKGLASIIWGIIIIVCSLVNWAGVHYKTNFGDVWILTIVAVAFQIFFSIRENKKRGFVSYEGPTIGFVWSAFGVSIFLMSMYVGTHKLNGDSSSLFMILYAIPTFITGGITKFKPMILGGIFCWAAAFTGMFTSVETDLLLMAACGLFAWLIPGILLWNRYKKSKAAHV